MRLVSSLVLVTLFFLQSCKNTPVEVEQNTPGFQVKVVDSSGNPILDVGFHYIFYLGANIVTRNYLFSYSLQLPDTLTMVILNSFGTEIAIPFYKQFRPAGSHTYNFDASTLSNGVYSCLITGSTITQTIHFFVLTDDIAQLTTLSPLSKTDEKGIIKLSYRSLGIGDKFNYQLGSSQLQLVIADSIKIFLTKQGYMNYLQSIKLDTTKFIDMTFQLQNK
jgi:hypothetical protein